MIEDNPSNSPTIGAKANTIMVSLSASCMRVKFGSPFARAAVGFSVGYRPSGRRGRWSRAVVRHGADPRMALAAVLGVSIDDIRVKDSPG